MKYAIDFFNNDRSSNNFDRIFGDFFEPSLIKDEKKHKAAFMPVSEFSEDSDSYFLTMDIPGVNKNDVNIELRDGLLVVSGKRESKKESAQFSELSYGAFTRSFKVPNDIMADSVTAEFVNGVLDLKLPKSEERKPKMIKIK